MWYIKRRYALNLKCLLSRMGKLHLPPLMFGHFCRYPLNVQNLLLRRIKLCFFLTLPIPYKKVNSTPDWFQNYNTHLAKNNVVLAINFFFSKKNIKINKKKKTEKMKIGGGATPTASLGVVEPALCPRGWSGHPQKAKKKKG